jgi:hypothetical protein
MIVSSLLLTVPAYQRAYEWGNNEVGEFWDDLSSYSAGDDEFFLGTLIFNVNQINQEISIVDGQQRITTIFIFLIACRVRLDQISTNQSITISANIKNLITSSDPATGNTIGFRLKASISIKEVFEEICNSGWEGRFPERINGRGVKQQVRRIQPVFNFFIQKLSYMDQPEISDLLAVLYKAYFVRIDINSDEEAFKIFERNNARGVDLEASDLLKNYLFQTIGSDISEEWNKIISNAGGSFPRMLKYFYVSQNGYIKKAELYRALKVMEPRRLLDELQDFSDFYVAVRSNDSLGLKSYFDESINVNEQPSNLRALLSHQDKITQLNINLDGLRFFKITQIYPLIFSAIHCFSRTPVQATNAGNSRLVNQLLLFFQNLENYHFVNNAICARVGNEVEKLYANYSEKFFNSLDFLATSRSFFTELRLKLAIEEEFSARFVEVNYEQPSALPLLMYIFDRFYNFDFGRNQVVGPSTLSRHPIFDPRVQYSRRSENIDHWFPQNARFDIGLSRDDIHNIGNLIVISYKANSSLNNDSPEEKIKKLKEKGPLRTAIQNSEYVTRFIDEYGRYSENWSAEIIKQRALALAKEAYQKVWRFKDS